RPGEMVAVEAECVRYEERVRYLDDHAPERPQQHVDEAGPELRVPEKTSVVLKTNIDLVAEAGGAHQREPERFLDGVVHEYGQERDGGKQHHRLEHDAPPIARPPRSDLCGLHVDHPPRSSGSSTP